MVTKKQEAILKLYDYKLVSQSENYKREKSRMYILRDPDIKDNWITLYIDTTGRALGFSKKAIQICEVLNKHGNKN